MQAEANLMAFSGNRNKYALDSSSSSESDQLYTQHEEDEEEDSSHAYISRLEGESQNFYSKNHRIIATNRKEAEDDGNVYNDTLEDADQTF